MFKIEFEFPCAFGDDADKRIAMSRKRIASISANEMTKADILSYTFAKTCLYFDGKLYLPSWVSDASKQDFSDTIWALDFFGGLIREITQAKDGKKGSHWFLDNPAELCFKKKGKEIEIWMEEGWEKTRELPRVQWTWKDFVKECVRNAEKLIKELESINPNVLKNWQVKELMGGIQKARKTIEE